MATKPRPLRAPSRHNRRPWDDVDLSPHEISAVKAMAAQHPKGFEILVTRICGVDQISFAAGGVDGQRATDFSEGKRWAGKQMRNVRDALMPTLVRGAPPADLPNAPTPAPDHSDQRGEP